MRVQDPFPPLQAAIAYAESWKPGLAGVQDELRSRRALDVIASAENQVGSGVMFGEVLHKTWRAAFHAVFRPGLAPWKSANEFDAFRQLLRAVFYAVREVMEGTRKIGEMLQALTGREPAEMARLLKAIEEARELEDHVFRDWPSFGEPWHSADSLPVDEALAEALGIRVEEARQKMDARRDQLNAKPE